MPAYANNQTVLINEDFLILLDTLNTRSKDILKEYILNIRKLEKNRLNIFCNYNIPKITELYIKL